MFLSMHNVRTNCRNCQRRKNLWVWLFSLNVNCYLGFMMFFFIELYYIVGSHAACLEATIIHGLLLYLFIAPSIYTCLNRSKLRRRFKLKGNNFTDCLTHAFCCFCALCQEYRELYNQGYDPAIGNLPLAPKNNFQIMYLYVIAAVTCFCTCRGVKADWNLVSTLTI